MGKIKSIQIFIFFFLVILFCGLWGRGSTIRADVSNATLYQNLDTDLQTFLSRKDNLSYDVDTDNKNLLVSRVENFAKSLGIPVNDYSLNNNGRKYSNVADDNGFISKYYHHTLSDDDLGISSELMVARETWGTSQGSTNILTDDQAKQLFQKHYQSYQFPIVNTAIAEKMNFAPLTQLRMVGGDDEGPTQILRQTGGYYRTIDTRQVINSFFQVDYDNSSSKIVGVSLNSWSPITSGRQTTLKSSSELKSEIMAKLESWSNTKKIALDQCLATFYQLTTSVIPSVTCFYSITFEDKQVEPASFSIAMVKNVSLNWDEETEDTDQVFYDGGATDQDQGNDSEIGDTPEDSDGGAPEEEAATWHENDGTYEYYDYSGLPNQYGEIDGSRFVVTYNTDENYFYPVAEKFYSEFSQTWSGPMILIAQKDNYVSSDPGVIRPVIEYFDLAYHVGHANVGDFQTSSGGDVNLHGSNYKTATQNYGSWSYSGFILVAELGFGDLEYLVLPGCLAGSAIYCESKSAISRFTDQKMALSSTGNTYQDNWDSIFSGLHIFSGHHGLTYWGKNHGKDMARLYAQYLTDGLTFIEAWDTANVDLNNFYYSHNDGCTQMDPNSCGSYTSFSCTRYNYYPSSFYIDSKKNVTRFNRSNYSSNPRIGDSEYDIDLIYRYQSETVPIYTPGYSLP